ncbi:MAG: hypothetical protein M3439_08910 [Chloroflexota bacterium]|nr:hypothetical protein [Chloroflexota bacterium]
MSAMPVTAETEERTVRATLGTVWEVDHQVRSANEGDTDHFSNAIQTSDDWLMLGSNERVNLRYVATVWLTFGTIPSPDYRASLMGFDGHCVVITGESVVWLQDELLKRSRRR